MAKSKRRASQGPEPSTGSAADGRKPRASDPAIEPPRLGFVPPALAAALAAVHAFWSAFQWIQLLRARSGGDYFCGLGGVGGCAAVWDSRLASAIQGGTGLPVAGWGLAWSMVAIALPVWVLARRARGRPVEPVWSATLLTALAGIASVMVLAGATLGVGQTCSTCVVTYALVLAYGAICLPHAGKLRFAAVKRGAVLALGAVVLAFLLLLYPGLRTPAVAARADAALFELAERADGTPLEKLISRLSPQLRQDLSSSLAAYAEEDRVPLRPARLLIGPSTAPVRITAFSDFLCGHCADLHATVKLLREKLPSGSFALELRQFPLDSSCNPAVTFSSGRGVRCLAARAAICIDQDAMAFSSALFENQRSLTTEKIYELAAPFMSRERLEECVASPETDAKLRDDIAWAMEHEIQGTPLVLVNGRKASPTVYFLFAMVLAGADVEHPAFASLPPPRPSARLP